MKDNYKIPSGSRESRIRANVKKRQNLKKKWDKRCKYEVDDNVAEQGATFAIDSYKGDTDNFVRLLDEGVVVDGYGEAYAVIAKGTLKAWLDNLPANYQGSINKDHCPAIDLGKFTKKDLRLVTLEDGRYGIDVNVKLDKELYAVKDLLKMMNRKALSSEFYYDAEQFVTAEAATGDKEQGKYLIPVINQISIEGYAVVDNPKNANSYDEELLVKASASEGEEMNDEEKKQLDAESEAEAQLVEEANDPNATDAEVSDASTDENTSEPETAANEEEAKVEASEDKEEVTLEKLAAAIESLKADIKAKDETIAELEAKVAEKEAKSDKYKDELEKLFNFATTEEPTVTEGKATSDEGDKEEKDAFTSALEAEFAKMEG